MATCKDCLYEKACLRMLEAIGYKVSTDYKGDADRCDTYTPKSQYAEVKHGKNVADYPSSAFECSLCGWSDWDLLTGDGVYNFCPNCGAKMDGGKTE